MSSEHMVELPGTVRVRPAEQTWEMLAEHLPDYGITRVADLTGLDSIGLPVWAAVRPASRTLSVSQGKGATDTLARISAVMEAIELWHVEQPLTVAAYGPACDIPAACPVEVLPLRTRVDAKVLARVVWEWTTASGLVTGKKTLLPVDVVRRRVQRPEWSPDLLRATSTGLACGNSRDEALLHALLEVVERDVLYRDGQSGGRHRTMIDPLTVDDPYAHDLLDRLASAGMESEIALVEGPYGLPVCLAYLWSEDLPVVFAGGGCHTTAGIALTRALSEAVQSRLTLISGTRDDLPSEPALADVPPSFRPEQRTGLVPWTYAVGRWTPVGLAQQVTEIARRIQKVTGHEPAALDLSDHSSPVHAVQVVAPGTRSRITRTMPR
ncbi:YcaO-like family protein [Streptomyces sp. NPDC094468]|uniref:YcaO-like family protein n=1 Tax=Streptomyces sp. NPDC094468 TaxID=3366066 RepID=UPI00382A76CD